MSGLQSLKRLSKTAHHRCFFIEYEDKLSLLIPYQIGRNQPVVQLVSVDLL